jgi:hypothetical protein
MQYILHRFRSGETINAVIRLRGRHNYTAAEVNDLQEKFNELNGTRVPRPGDTYKIPLEGLLVDDFGELVPVPTFATTEDRPVVTDPGDDRQDPPQGEEPGDPRQPVHDLPTGPVSGTEPEQGTKDDRDQEVPPDTGEDPSQNVQEERMHGATLSVSGTRRPTR